MGPPAAENFNMTNQSAPENGPMTPQQTHHPVLQEQVSPTAEGKITLFHWQIQQETQRVGDVSPEMLNMQDADGDTYVLMKEFLNVEIKWKDMDEQLIYRLEKIINI